ncbi:MAG: hypothetical protein VX740_06080 [Pseudomonadota bacterium]|nr:hypothetical protein [Pseudomonadota bacterium]
MTTEINGQYYSPEENDVINLATVTKLWHADDGIFSKSDKLYFTSCGEDYDVKKSPEEISALFNKLSNTGAYIEIGDKLYNTKSIQSAYFEDGKLYFQVAGDEESSKMSEGDAEKILSKLLEQKRFQRIDNHIVNMNKVVNIWFEKGGWFSNDRLKINFMGQASAYINMSERDAERAQQETLKRPQFKRVGGEVINVAIAGNVWKKDNALHIQYPGTSCKIELRPNDHNVLDLFTPKAGYTSIGGEKVNSKITSCAWRTEGGLFSKPRFKFNILSDTFGVTAKPELSEMAMANFAEDADYIYIGEGLINMNAIGHAYYDGKELHFSMGTDDHSQKMDKAEADKTMAALYAHEKFTKIEEHAVNIQFASRLKYNNDKLSYTLGRDEYTHEISAEDAKSILNKVKELGQEKERHLAELRANYLHDDNEETAWDSDLLAEIYEEIDTMHTTNTVIFVTVIMPMMTQPSTTQ